MNRIALLMAVASLSLPSLAQVVPPLASPSDSCLIVKHKGTAGRRLIWFALIGVPIAPGASYDYVDAVGYKAEKMSYKGKELQKLGVRVIVLEKPTGESILAARRSCSPEILAPAVVPVAASVVSPTVVPVQAHQESAFGDARPVRGETISATGTGEGTQQESLGDAARREKAKKAARPKE